MKNCLFACFIYIAICGISMLLFAGLYALICLCFAIEFKWSIAIGLWLIVWAIKLFIKGLRKSKNE